MTKFYQLPLIDIDNECTRFITQMFASKMTEANYYLREILFHDIIYFHDIFDKGISNSLAKLNEALAMPHTKYK